MQITNVEQPTNVPRVSLLPAAFILGMFLLVTALFLQLNTYAPGMEMMPGVVALALTIVADFYFLCIWRRGGRIARIFALLGGAAALLNSCNLLWWAVMLPR